MDYAHAGYYAPPVQQYPYYGVPAKLGHQYTAQEEHPNDPAVSLRIHSWR